MLTQPEHDEQTEFAEDFIAQTMQDWIDAGNEPSILLTAMRDILVDVCNNVQQQPVH